MRLGEHTEHCDVFVQLLEDADDGVPVESAKAGRLVFWTSLRLVVNGV